MNKIKKILLSTLTFFALNPIAIKAEETNQHNDEQPMSVLLLGVDTGALGRVEKGRSDVLMVATINPTTNRVTITSIPRDTYTEIIGKGFLDKVNHAYAFGGAEMAMETVNHLLDIELDHYVAVNMGGLEQIVDAVGGVEVIPPNTFTIGEYTFNEGEVTPVDGAKALAYSRERYTSGGDYARQERQREIIQAVASKAMHSSSIFNLQAILSTLSKNMETDISILELLSLFTTYKDKEMTFETYQLVGQGQMIDGIYYDIPDETDLSETIERIKEELN